jgi:hypothetical protein
MVAWWLCLPGGRRLRVGAAGAVFGRSAACDVVLADERASRQHAVVFIGSRGPRVAPLGRAAITVNGDAVEHDRDLAAGDRVGLPGLGVEVAVEDAADPHLATTTWVLAWRDGGAFGVVTTPFTIGGASDVDLRVDGWPARVLRLHVAERLEVEAIEAIAIDGFPVQPGEREPLGAGATLGYAGAELSVIAGGVLEEVSTVSDPLGGGVARPTRVRVEFMPRGGRVILTIGGRDTTVYLADRRCDLVAALLQPPAPYVAGDFVPDDDVLPRVWPGRDMGRPELNVLIHRVRRDLSRADLDGAALLVRAPGGNATCFALAPRAAVSLT